MAATDEDFAFHSCVPAGDNALRASSQLRTALYVMNTTVDPRWYELRNAVFQRRFNDAEALIRNEPSLLWMTNDLGETVLHFLAVENDREGVEWLQARGADLDTKNAFGTPVLFEVAQLEYKELYAWFVESGADVTAVDGEGNSVVDYLLEYDLERMATWVQER